MATPSSPNEPLVLKILTTSATNAGEKIVVRNLTRLNKIIGTLNGKKECIISPHSTHPGWAAGDTIIVEIHGRLQGYVTGTLTAKGGTLTIVDAADTATPGFTL